MKSAARGRWSSGSAANARSALEVCETSRTHASGGPFPRRWKTSRCHSSLAPGVFPGSRFRRGSCYLLSGSDARSLVAVLHSHAFGIVARHFPTIVPPQFPKTSVESLAIRQAPNPPRLKITPGFFRDLGEPRSAQLKPARRKPSVSFYAAAAWGRNTWKPVSVGRQNAQLCPASNPKRWLSRPCFIAHIDPTHAGGKWTVRRDAAFERHEASYSATWCRVDSRF